MFIDTIENLSSLSGPGDVVCRSFESEADVFCGVRPGTECEHTSLSCVPRKNLSSEMMMSSRIDGQIKRPRLFLSFRNTMPGYRTGRKSCQNCIQLQYLQLGATHRFHRTSLLSQLEICCRSRPKDSAAKQRRASRFDPLGWQHIWCRCLSSVSNEENRRAIGNDILQKRVWVLFRLPLLEVILYLHGREKDSLFFSVYPMKLAQCFFMLRIFS